MLNLAALDREMLRESGALTTEKHGTETLLGLSIAESSFVIEVEKLDSNDICAAELDLYRQLKLRHFEARMLYIAALALAGRDQHAASR